MTLPRDATEGTDDMSAEAVLALRERRVELECAGRSVVAAWDAAPGLHTYTHSGVLAWLKVMEPEIAKLRKAVQCSL